MSPATSQPATVMWEVPNLTIFLICALSISIQTVYYVMVPFRSVWDQNHMEKVLVSIVDAPILPIPSTLLYCGLGIMEKDCTVQKIKTFRRSQY